MHRLSTLAFACTIALAAPAFAASTDYLLKFKGVEGDSGRSDKHKNQIEILSYSWGETRSDVDGNGQADALTDGLLVVRYNQDPALEAAKVKKVDSISVKQSVARDGVGQDRDYAKEPATAAGGVCVAVGDVNGDGRAGEAHQRQKEIGAVPSAGAPAKPKTGSMEYLNRTRQKTLSSPAPAGSLNVVLAPGHGLCSAGKSLGMLTLAGSGGRIYTLTGVAVAACAEESVSLNYTKIE